MKTFMYREPLLPSNFRFPREYEQLAENGSWPDLRPWEFLATNMGLSLSLFGTLMQKFPRATLVPFARTSDPTGLHNDGYVVLACFDGTDPSDQPRVRIYDFRTPAKSPWDNLSYSTFKDWLDAAAQESEQFKADQAEAEND